MIDEKKLIEELRKSYTSYNDTPMEDSDMLISFKSVCKIINNQPKVAVMTWMPIHKQDKEIEEE